MKKVLFATTALIATASVAAADVSFGGYGRFGATYSDATGTGVTAQENRFRLNIDGSTEADNGLEFGARVRLQSDDNGAAGLNGANFFVRTGGFQVTVGNTGGAIDNMNGYYAGAIGLTDLMYGNVLGAGYDGYSSTGAGRGVIALSYAVGDFKAYAGYSNTAGTERSSISGQYTFSGWTVALGYQDSSNNAEDLTALTVTGKVGIAALSFAAGDHQGGQTYGISASFDVGAATTVTASVTTDQRAGGTQNYGLGVKHDLGGGASIRGGVAQVNNNTVADLGLLFNF